MYYSFFYEEHLQQLQKKVELSKFKNPYNI